MEERRQARSENPWMAGDLYLQVVAETHGLDHLTLATREGLLLSSTAEPQLSNRLAAVAPVFAEEPATLKPGMLEELAEHMPDGATWTKPAGGFFVWVTLPEGIDSQAKRGHVTG